MLTPVVAPLQFFADTSGKELDSGYIYIGSPNLNPETNPISVYWDTDLSIPAAQPIRTIGGYPSRSGSPGNLYTDRDFSMTVRDRQGTLVSTSPIQPYDGIGAAFDGVTDDTAALIARIATGLATTLPPGTALITSALVISADGTVFVGSGSGATTIKNEGAGNAVEVKSSGGADSTKLDMRIGGFSITGQAGTTNGLYVYDVARCEFFDIDSRSNDGHGILAEQAINCVFDHCKALSNGGDGIKISAGTKAAVEYRSNANIIFAPIASSNTGNGINIARSNGNKVYGGDCSTNDIGVLLDGAARNKIDGVWIENNTTSSVTTQQSTTPTTYNSDANRIVSCMISGASVDIGNGTGNALSGNYIGDDINITGAGATPNTYVGEQTAFSGSLTDSGHSTRYLHGTAKYIKASAAKRWQLTIGSTVDYASDIAAFRFAGVKGISGTTTQANNLRGSATLSSGTVAVSFGTAETNSTYYAFVQAQADETLRVSNKTVNGFTVTSDNGSSAASFDWFILR